MGSVERDLQRDCSQIKLLSGLPPPPSLPTRKPNRVPKVLDVIIDSDEQLWNIMSINVDTAEKAQMHWNWAHMFQAQLNAAPRGPPVGSYANPPINTPGPVVGGVLAQQWNTWAQHQVQQQQPVAQSLFKHRLNGNAAGAKQDNEKKEETDEVWSYLEAQAAFLGPSLWDNGDLKMEYMDLDEFLSENGIPVKDNGLQGRSPQQQQQQQQQQQERTPPQQGPSNNQSNNDANDPVLARASSSSNVSGNATPTRSVPSSPAVTAVNEDDENSVSGCSSSSMLDAISPATCTSLRSTPAKRKRNTVSIASSFNDNSSDDGSYVPGHDFDPKSRPFSQEELRPQPMSKKSKKQYVPDDLKDDKYWARRRKNNMAAKRSRDARRVKENQIAMRAAFLEKEVNAVLRAELDKVTKLYASALKRLEQYEKPTKKY